MYTTDAFTDTVSRHILRQTWLDILFHFFFSFFFFTSRFSRFVFRRRWSGNLLWAANGGNCELGARIRSLKATANLFLLFPSMLFFFHAHLAYKYTFKKKNVQKECILSSDMQTERPPHYAQLKSREFFRHVHASRGIALIFAARVCIPLLASFRQFVFVIDPSSSFSDRRKKHGKISQATKKWINISTSRLSHFYHQH